MTRVHALAVALLLAVAPATLACARNGLGTEAAIDEVLLAYLSQARAHHHEADLAEDAGDTKGAIAALERLLARPRPRQAPEIDEVVADTHARLGDLRSRLGDFDRAGDDVDRGLAVAPKISYFQGHLHEVRGLVEERRSKALAAKGDADGAAKARENAMKAYEEAIAIQGEVIKRGTQDGGAP